MIHNCLSSKSEHPLLFGHSIRKTRLKVGDVTRIIHLATNALRHFLTLTPFYCSGRKTYSLHTLLTITQSQTHTHSHTDGKGLNLGLSVLPKGTSTCSWGF